MSTRKPLIAGNWKMNLDKQASKKLVEELANSNIDYKKVDILVAPSSILIQPVICSLSKIKNSIIVAAQNISHEEKGAFTGETSAAMVAASGAKYTLIGHSERRQLYTDTDQLINLKVKKALEHNLNVILCIGETLWDREASAAVETVLAQVGKALKDIKSLSKIVLAYEPVWAIGTGVTASPKDAQNMHKAIREYISKIKGKAAADKLRILYGGSVTPSNAKELLSQKDIDGALVGGASLKSEDFLKIINFDKK